jgi:hypothetical protein
MLRRLRDARHGEVEEIEAAVAAVRGGDTSGAAVARLERIAERFRRSVEMG